MQIGLLQGLTALFRRNPDLPGVQRSLLRFCAADAAALHWALQVPGMQALLLSLQLPSPLQVGTSREAKC